MFRNRRYTSEQIKKMLNSTEFAQHVIDYLQEKYPPHESDNKKQRALVKKHLGNVTPSLMADALRLVNEVECQQYEVTYDASQNPFSSSPALVDQKALELAQQFVPSSNPQLLAKLQCAFIEAMMFVKKG